MLWQPAMHMHREQPDAALLWACRQLHWMR
jgi:hypothetical protein